MAIVNRLQKVVLTILLLLNGVVLFAGSAVAQNTQKDIDRAFDQATQLHQAGDLEGAIRGYTSILEKYPDRIDVRSNLGAAYSGLGRYEEAIEQYKRALAVDSRNDTIRFNLSLAYYKAAWFSEASVELTRFLAANPKSPQSLNATVILADCQVRIGDYKKVIELLSPIADADSANRTVAYLLGSALIGDNQIAKGQEIIDRVFRDDDSAEARLL